ncbi:hypothetical protein B0T26DRAFT_672055 [Lasiosphaeria miniovina]|uniref:Malate dehydrogenase n=1 Tax=Lasiosphaeria miniovina TaxID=1954250 RepID=A0AA40B455_9PEZI|nr:uncharacterized protein B0T26DRAFT_672055 [Lasiosphaeria miniovina]KAK0727379.1 hypothetical protein B0T26DRAFT_672055 [Lasiosphaeria miniovina]
MRASTFILSALGSSVFAAPTFPDLNVAAALPGGIDTVAEYFNLLASKVQASKILIQAPVCDLSKAFLPAAPTPLPPPTAGLYLKHVALGRGTQNYTCDLKNATAVPVANGAVATLFNASCLASTYPDLASSLSRAAIQFNLTENESKLAPSNLGVSGLHYFTTTTTPFFNLDVSQNLKLGEAQCNKTNNTPAPANAAKGQKGEPAVPWLKLVAKAGASGGLQEVYRVETAGGSAPASCKGLTPTFEVQYAAQYWFYAK